MMTLLVALIIVLYLNYNRLVTSFADRKLKVLTDHTNNPSATMGNKLLRNKHTPFIVMKHEIMHIRYGHNVIMPLLWTIIDVALLYSIMLPSPVMVLEVWLIRRLTGIFEFRADYLAIKDYEDKEKGINVLMDAVTNIRKEYFEKINTYPMYPRIKCYLYILLRDYHPPVAWRRYFLNKMFIR